MGDERCGRIELKWQQTFNELSIQQKLQHWKDWASSVAFVGQDSEEKTKIADQSLLLSSSNIISRTTIECVIFIFSRKFQRLDPFHHHDCLFIFVLFITFAWQQQKSGTKVDRLTFFNEIKPKTIQFVLIAQLTKLIVCPSPHPFFKLLSLSLYTFANSNDFII